MTIFCCNLTRGPLVRAHPTLDGIDYLEVLDRDAPAGSPRQRTLLVHCFKSATALKAANVRIIGGVRIKPVKIVWAYSVDVIAGKGVLTAAEAAYLATLSDPAKILAVRTDVYGDYSTYTLRLVQGPGLDEPPPNFDPILSSIDFSFKVECPSDFDCQPQAACPPLPHTAPPINYLARDYDTFRQLMLDRISLLSPAWQERHSADLGIALVELLAYVGDRLSYRQDAIASEAYLATARSRISVRRHARLLDYYMHDGCNARAFMRFTTQNGPQFLAASTQILSRPLAMPSPPVLAKDSLAYNTALDQGSLVFETMHPVTLYPENNNLRFYTWAEEQCCLPQGCAQATLIDDDGSGHRLLLRAGDVLSLEEALGPKTGNPADADPTRRHVLRLKSVSPEASVSVVSGIEIRTPGTLVTDPLTNQGIVKITWYAEDALPFAFCLSSPYLDGEIRKYYENVSIAHGNVVLTDHGRSLEPSEWEIMGPVPEPGPGDLPAQEGSFCAPASVSPNYPRFRPRLSQGPLTQQARISALDGEGNPIWPVFDPQRGATVALLSSQPGSRPQFALPALSLTESSSGSAWEAEWDLLESTELDPHFVAEVEEDGLATLRFGDGTLGLRPEAGLSFVAKYRVGNGGLGNVGAEKLVVLVDDGRSVFNAADILDLRNPQAAQGGIDPESLEQVRQKAPFAFRSQQRAVTLGDYEEKALLNPALQGVKARYRWTGSWRTVFLSPDWKGREGLDAEDTQALREDLIGNLERFRMAGYDLDVDQPLYVSLEIGLQICVRDDYVRADVEKALLQIYSTGVLPDGSLGVFHPDRFVFGETVYLSQITGPALAVDGVDMVKALVFRRQDRNDGGAALLLGELDMQAREIPRLDNDPNFPEHGLFTLTMCGGL